MSIAQSLNERQPKPLSIDFFGNASLYKPCKLKSYEAWVCKAPVGTIVANLLKHPEFKSTPLKKGYLTPEERCKVPTEAINAANYVICGAQSYILRDPLGYYSVIDENSLCRMYTWGDGNIINQETLASRLLCANRGDFTATNTRVRDYLQKDNSNIKGVWQNALLPWYKVVSKPTAGYHARFLDQTKIRDASISLSYGVEVVNRRGVQHGKGDFLICDIAPNQQIIPETVRLVNGLEFTAMFNNVGWSDCIVPSSKLPDVVKPVELFTVEDKNFVYRDTMSQLESLQKVTGRVELGALLNKEILSSIPMDVNSRDVVLKYFSGKRFTKQMSEEIGLDFSWLHRKVFVTPASDALNLDLYLKLLSSFLMERFLVSLVNTKLETGHPLHETRENYLDLLSTLVSDKRNPYKEFAHLVLKGDFVSVLNVSYEDLGKGVLPLVTLAIRGIDPTVSIAMTFDSKTSVVFGRVDKTLMKFTPFCKSIDLNALTLSNVDSIVLDAFSKSSAKINLDTNMFNTKMVHAVVKTLYHNILPIELNPDGTVNQANNGTGRISFYTKSKVAKDGSISVDEGDNTTIFFACSNGKVNVRGKLNNKVLDKTIKMNHKTGIYGVTVTAYMYICRDLDINVSKYVLGSKSYWARIFEGTRGTLENWGYTGIGLDIRDLVVKDNGDIHIRFGITRDGLDISERTLVCSQDFARFSKNASTGGIKTAREVRTYLDEWSNNMSLLTDNRVILHLAQESTKTDDSDVYDCLVDPHLLEISFTDLLNKILAQYKKYKNQ